MNPWGVWKCYTTVVHIVWLGRGQELVVLLRVYIRNSSEARKLQLTVLFCYATCALLVVGIPRLGHTQFYIAIKSSFFA